MRFLSGIADNSEGVSDVPRGGNVACDAQSRERNTEKCVGIEETGNNREN